MKSPLLWLELSALLQSYFSGDPRQRQQTAPDRALKLLKTGTRCVETGTACGGHSKEGAPVSMRPQSPQPQEHLEDKHLLLAMKRLKDLKDLFRQQTGCFHFLKAKINSITNLSVITTVCFAFFHYFPFGTVGTLVTTHSIFPLIHSTTGFFS